MIRSPMLGEFAGTLMLVLLGNGVNAGVSLKRSKAEGSGWFTITAGWAFAVLCGIFTAILFGSTDGHINPAITLAFAISNHDYSKLAAILCRAGGGRILRRCAGVALLPSPLGDYGRRRDEARGLLHRAGDPQLSGERVLRGACDVCAGDCGGIDELEAGALDRGRGRGGAVPGELPGVGDRSRAGRARRGTRSIRRATSVHAPRMRCCPSPARAAPIGAMPGSLWWARWSAQALPGWCCDGWGVASAPSVWLRPTARVRRLR